MSWSCLPLCMTIIGSASDSWQNLGDLKWLWHNVSNMAREFYTHQNWCQHSPVFWPVPKLDQITLGFANCVRTCKFQQFWGVCRTGILKNSYCWNSLLCTHCLTLRETDSFDTSLYLDFHTHSLMYTRYITSFAHLLLQHKDRALSSACCFDMFKQPAC